MVDELSYGGWDGAVPKNVDYLDDIIGGHRIVLSDKSITEVIKEKLDALWWEGRLDTKAMNYFLSSAALRLRGSSDIMKVLLDYEGYVKGGIAPKSINNAFAEAANGDDNEGDKKKIMQMLLDRDKITVKNIFSAIRKGRIFQMLFKRPEINAEGINKALAGAAGRGNSDIVKMLFEEHGQKITPEGINKALVEAAGNGRSDIVKMLLDRSEVTPNGINNALAGAAGRGNSDIVKMLLGDIVKMLLDRSEVTPNGINNALAGAAGRGNSDIVKMLFKEHGQKITPEGINEALVKAAGNGRSDIVKMLLNRSEVTPEGINKAFKHAATGCNKEIMKILLNNKHGSQITAQCIKSIFTDAIKYDNMESLKVLLDKDVQALFTKDVFKEGVGNINDAFIKVAQSGVDETMEVLQRLLDKYGSQITHDSINKASNFYKENKLLKLYQAGINMKSTQEYTRVLRF